MMLTYSINPVKDGVELFIRKFDGKKWGEPVSYGIFRNEEWAMIFVRSIQ